MAKRYGRNQRRQAREQIAQLQETVDFKEQQRLVEQSRHREQERETQRLMRQWDDDIRRVLGEKSAARIFASVLPSHRLPDHLVVAVSEGLVPLTDVASEMSPMRREVMFRIIVALEEMREPGGGQRVLVQADDKRLAYYISRELIEDTRVRDADYIATYVAEMLRRAWLEGVDAA